VRGKSEAAREAGVSAGVIDGLVDEGTLQMDRAVDEFLPELTGQRVLRSLDAAVHDTVPAKRPITLNDLLTFRLGFGVVMEPPGTYPIQTAEEALQRSVAWRR